MEGRGLPFGQREAAERREGGSCPLAARSDSTGKQKEGGQLAETQEEDREESAAIGQLEEGKSVARRTGGQHENAVQSPCSSESKQQILSFGLIFPNSYFIFVLIMCN